MIARERSFTQSIMMGRVAGTGENETTTFGSCLMPSSQHDDDDDDNDVRTSFFIILRVETKNGLRYARVYANNKVFDCMSASQRGQAKPTRILAIEKSKC